MISKKLLFFLLLASLAFTDMDARRKQRSSSQTPAGCTTKENCEDPKGTCGCFCGRKMDIRARERGDHPMFRNNGVNGKPTCFCKEADAQLYYENIGQEYIPESEAVSIPVSR